MRSFHLTVIVLSLMVLSRAIDVRLESGADLTFNTSMMRDTVSLSLSSTGKANTSFFVESEIFSPLMNPYELLHNEGRITSTPVIEDDNILFNDFDEIGYWLATKHKVKHADASSVQFATLRVYEKRDGPVQDFLLPMFPQPFTSLPIESIHRCGSVLVSLYSSPSSVDLSLFSATSSGEDWNIDPNEWDWDFDKRDARFHFGRQTRSDLEKTVRI
jgi:hypothetical protein